MDLTDFCRNFVPSKNTEQGREETDGCIVPPRPKNNNKVKNLVLM